MEFKVEGDVQDYLDGKIILIDKPLNWTSFDVVNKVRYTIKREFGLKKIKVGHAGTLDPLASGLLIICCGKFTKRISEFQNLDKEYEGVISLGATTASYDLETELNTGFKTEHITENSIEKVRENFVGVTSQVAPIYSAKKIDGKKAYDLARSGSEVMMAPHQITINTFAIETQDLLNLKFIINCSKGTYIRSIANDFGKALNSGGHLSQLRRTKIGDFDVSDAYELFDGKKKKEFKVTSKI